MKGAAGKYMEDAWVPFGFAAVNLVTSILLAKYMGVAGVFLGSIIGSLCTADWYRPLIIYKHVFHSSVTKYYRLYAQYIILGGICIIVGYQLCAQINFAVPLVSFLVKGIVAATCPIMINTLCFRKTKEYTYIVDMVRRVTAKMKRIVCIRRNE